MKKKGGVLNNVYLAMSVIGTAVEVVGKIIDNMKLCIGVGIVLVGLVIGSLVISYYKLQYLREQKESKLKRLDKRLADTKKAMLDKALSADMRDELQNEEAEYLSQRAETEDQYYVKKTEVRKRNKERLCTCGIAFAIIITANMHSISTYAKEYIDMIKNELTQAADGTVDHDEEGSQTDDITVSSSEEEDEKDIQERPNESEDAESIGSMVQGMSFYLDNPTLEWIPTPEMEAAIFYVPMNHPDIQNIVKLHVDQLLKTNLEDTYNDCLSSAEERLASDASKLETDFDNSRKLAKQYAAENNPTKWKEALRHSTDLDEIIDNRLELWKSNKRNGTLASLIANNYQDYALEYQNQKKSGYTILSYYIKTIIWAESELCYEDTNKKETFEYLKARYWDIATCQAIPEQYRDNAEAIYLEMGDYEDYMK